jgi:hypothetical protein
MELHFFFAVTPVCISKFVRVLTAGVIPYAATSQVQSVNRMILNWKAQVLLPKSKTFFTWELVIYFGVALV